MNDQAGMVQRVIDSSGLKAAVSPHAHRNRRVWISHLASRAIYIMSHFPHHQGYLGLHGGWEREAGQCSKVGGLLRFFSDQHALLLNK